MTAAPGALGRSSISSPLRPPANGTTAWYELYTTDMELEFDFYNKLFGWMKISEMEMGQMGEYRLFEKGDRLMTKHPHVPIQVGVLLHSGFNQRGGDRVISGDGKIFTVPSRCPGIARSSKARTAKHSYLLIIDEQSSSWTHTVS